MKQTALLRKVSLIGATAACIGALTFALVGCGSTNYGYTGGVAATVNGTEIQEDTITKYIQDFRNSSNLTSDQDWANWMKQNSMDPETVRSQVIDYYTDIELKKQACDEKGITIDESKVDEQINKIKANYKSDDEWKQALQSGGVTEEQYRESIEQNLRDQALMQNVAGDAATVDDSQVLDMMNTYYTMFDGAKRSSHILFSSDDQDTAQQVLDQINAGTLDFADAAKQYSTDTGSKDNGGDVGWDVTNTFVQPYTDALANLSEGQVSGLVTSDYGIHIIKCTQEFHCDGKATSLDQYPSEFVDYISNILKQQNQSQAYNDWFNSYKEQADIQINDMPDNIPYNLDMTQYEDNNDQNGDGSGDQGADQSADQNADQSADQGQADNSANQGADQSSNGSDASADAADTANAAAQGSDTSGDQGQSNNQ